MPDQYKTELGLFFALFSADREQRFEGWVCGNKDCIGKPTEEQRVEEKFISDNESELRCAFCGATDSRHYTTDYHVDESRNLLVEVFGDLDAVTFK